MSLAIEIKNISKKYNISHQRGYVALRDKLAHPIKAIREAKINKEEFWALDNINLEIGQGDIVGIIGPNGSGKSTLLKVLSQITSPTKGEVVISGKVASLLEVGTGFHPELTGRENIYLSGVILGMSKLEINDKFEKIVEFADVEKFLDVPVKRYSSGMLVRLGFAVAAHLDSDILLIDEVLAVGDAKFQEKCLSKMNDIANLEKRTILFVSHDMGAVRKLCKQCVLLNKGKIEQFGEVVEIINLYENNLLKNTGNALVSAKDRKLDTEQYHLSRAELRNEQGALSSIFKLGEKIIIHLFSNKEALLDNFTVEFKLYNSRGAQISFGTANPIRQTFYKKADQHFICALGPLNLTTGNYWFDFAVKIWGGERWDEWKQAIGFKVTECDLYQTGHSVPGDVNGDFIINQEWSRGD